MFVVSSCQYSRHPVNPMSGVFPEYGIVSPDSVSAREDIAERAMSVRSSLLRTLCAGRITKVMPPICRLLADTSSTHCLQRNTARRYARLTSSVCEHPEISLLQNPRRHSMYPRFPRIHRLCTRQLKSLPSHGYHMQMFADHPLLALEGRAEACSLA